MCANGSPGAISPPKVRKVGRTASLQLGVGDHHVEDRLRVAGDRVPDADGLEQPPRRGRDRRGARIAAHARAERRIGDRSPGSVRRAPGAARSPAPGRRSRRRRSAHRSRNPVRSSAASLAALCVHHGRKYITASRHKVLPCPPSKTCSRSSISNRSRSTCSAAVSPQVGWQRVFGGQVIGQALVAATPHRRGHAAAFAARLFPARPAIRRCRSSTRSTASATARASPPAAWSRSSTASAIFSMSVSFHNDEDGLDHQMPMPDVPPPDAAAERRRDQARRSCRSCPKRCAAITSASGRSSCARSSSTATLGKKPEDGRFNVWIRATAPLPDDPAIHRCVLAYASDMTLLDTALMPHRRSVFDRDIMAASLDHALWFHRPFRADEWLLYAQDSPNLHGARGFAPRPDLRGRRHAGRLGGAGRPAARAAVRGQARPAVASCPAVCHGASICLRDKARNPLIF